MKKKFIMVVAIVCTNIYLFAQNSFNDFVYKNPFLDDLEIYIDNPELLRGKIFKTVTEEYDLTSDGKKKYGDSYSTHTGIKYYFFDSDNILRKKILIVLQNEKIVTKKSWQYINTVNGFSVLYNNYDYDYDYNQERMEDYTNYQDEKNNSITFTYYEDEIELTRKIQMSNGKKIKSEQKYDWDPTFYEYKYEGDLCTEINKNGNKLLRTIIYKNGKEIKNTQEGYKDNGQLVELIDFNKSMTEGIKKTQILINGILKEQKIIGRVTRKYNIAGFVEYEQQAPYEGKEGTYITYNAEILSTEDDCLKKYNK